MTLQYTRVLKYKLPMMSGADVEALQRRLVALGLGTPGDVDGLYGPGTRDLVRAWQRRAGLGADGVAGRDTIKSLNDGAVTPSRPVLSADGLDPNWLPPASMKRIIVHWTGGSHRVSASDRKHYHFIVDGDGNVHRGNRSVADNVSTVDNIYAAHTYRCNTGSIGVAVCAMLNASQSARNWGRYPMNEVQWTKIADVSAALCHAYGIPCTPRTVLGHGEVQDILDITQNGKWDPLVLPWRSDLSTREVGNLFRETVAKKLADLVSGVAAEPEDELPADTAIVSGEAGEVEVPATRFDARDWLDVDALADALNWPEPVAEEDLVRIEAEKPFTLPLTGTSVGDVQRRWVEVPDVSVALGLERRTSANGQVMLARPRAAVPEGLGDFRPVIVARGDTLTKIAGRELGAPSRWQEIRDADGNKFSAQAAREIDPGDVVLVPKGDGTAEAAAPESPVGDSPVALSDEQIATIAVGVGKLAPSWLSSAGRGTMMSSARAILGACRDERVLDPAHIAYVLATANHETNLGRQMIEHWGPTAQQLTYVGRLGNATLEDAELYRGRGFVQLTGKSNYERYGRIFGQPFVDQPELLEDPRVAALVLVQGMKTKGFVSPSILLKTFGFDREFEFVNARKIINRDRDKSAGQKYPGLTIGVGIAHVAQEYAELVRQTANEINAPTRLELAPDGTTA